MANSKKTPVAKIHSDHKEWLNEIGLHRDEILVFEKRLAEVVKKNNHVSVTANAEHFQNQFTLHGRTLSDIDKRLKRSEKIIDKAIAKFPAFFDDATTQEHAYLLEKMNIQRRLFKALKNDFAKFLSKTL